MIVTFMTRLAPRIILQFFWIGAFILMLAGATSVYARDITNESPVNSDPKENAVDWAELTRQDLQAAYDITLENHPGVYNDLDPDFKDVAANALENALALAANVQDAAGYEYALDAFAAKFRDGHFRFYLTSNAEKRERQYEWPGFIMAWHEGRGVVHSVLDEQTELAGAEVIACDDRPIRDVVLSNTFEFGGNPSVLGDWIKYAPQVFIDGGNPFVRRPQRCIFRLLNGMQQEQELQWSLVSEADWVDRYLLTVLGPKEPASLETFGEGRYWISVSTLFPHGEAEVEQLEALISQIQAQANLLRDAEAIVFDLRRATGGSSIWMRRMANALWGEVFVNSRESNSDVYAEYRASHDNLEYLKTLLDIPAIANAPADIVQFFNNVIAGVEHAYNTGEPLYSTQNHPSRQAETVAAAGVELSNPVSGEIYVFMTGLCGSACLDGIDLLSQFENVTLVGMPTSADTDYIEVRDVRLPSERAIFGFPIKVDRDRPRPSGFYYEPDIPYPLLDLSREAVESWLVGIIDGRSADADRQAQ